jgi:hypothetical protein
MGQPMTSLTPSSPNPLPGGGRIAATATTEPVVDGATVPSTANARLSGGDERHHATCAPAGGLHQRCSRKGAARERSSEVRNQCVSCDFHLSTSRRRLGQRRLTQPRWGYISPISDTHQSRCDWLMSVDCLTEGSRYRRGLTTTDGDNRSRAVAAALHPTRLMKTERT